MTPPSTPARRRTALGAAVVALVAPLALASPAYASSVSNEVVFTSDADGDGVYSVVLRNLETRASVELLPADTTNEWVYDDPELSADGTRVALSTDRDSAGGVVEGIAVVDVATRSLRRLTNPPQSDTTFSLDVAPAWSPDGSTIVFTRITTTRTTPSTITTALFTVTTGGSPAVQAVPNATDGYTADWSPDGSKIVYAQLADGADSGPLLVINRDGSGRTALGPSGLMPAWSPDGSTIAYATVTARDSDRSRAEDTAQIATVPAAGGEQRVLGPTRPDSSKATVAEYPAWTPDGRSLVYDLFGYSSTDSFPPGDLWAVDRDGVRAGRVLTTPGDEAQPHLQGPAPAAVASGTASLYVPVTPTRVLDTRPAPNNVGPRVGKLGPGGTVDLQVTGLQTASGPVPDDATAVVLNVTVAGPTAATDVRAYPAGSAVPRASNVNAGPGQVVPNLVTVSLGAGGAVTLRNSSGEAHVIADLAGYYRPATAGGAGFSALDPGRVLDTRNGTGAPQAPVGEGQVLDLRVTGSLSTADGRTLTVPADATAVVLNVTATRGNEDTDVRVYPTPASGSGFPTVSNLNLRPNTTAANLVTVTVGDGGRVRLRNAQGRVDLLADLAGYYSASSPGRFVPVSPLRFLDTRSGVGAAPIPTTAGAFVDLQVAGTRGVPAGATAAVLNLTATGVSQVTDVRAFPTGTATLPTVSNLNVVTGATRANAAVVKTGTGGGVRIRNAAGELQLIADLAGYFTGQ